MLLFPTIRRILARLASPLEGPTEEPAQKPIEPTLTRDTYISAPSPIELELRDVFGDSGCRVVFDIGACEGEDSIKYALLYPGATVYAFEPMPGNIARIRDLVARYGVEQRVKYFQMALSDSQGSSVFYASSGAPDHLENSIDWDYGNKSGSLLQPDAVKDLYPWLEFDDHSTVRTETLQAFCTEAGVSHIDLVHIDVQGAELMVLRGAGDMLKNIRMIWMEVEEAPLYLDQPLAQDVENFMLSNGFKKVKDTVGEVSGDQLYLREK